LREDRGGGGRKGERDRGIEKERKRKKEPEGERGIKHQILREIMKETD